MTVQESLFSLQDLKYRDFHAGLIPTIDPKNIIGVRMPALRALAKKLYGTPEGDEFLRTLPHRYYDENTLHGLMVSLIRDIDESISALDTFLPYVDNWATCDVISPKPFGKHPPQLLPAIRAWIFYGHTFAIRFGIRMLMDHYLDEAFEAEYLHMVTEVSSQEYYVRMAIAWLFATALVKQPEAAMPFLRGQLLDPWTHNKTIRKAIESYRIPPEMKEELRSLTI